MEDKKQPIVVKKIIQGHGHHGGSWKVAFADFATAMMAFFMVLWLVGQTDANKRGGIADYFQNPSMVRGNSEAPTGSIGPGGAGMSLISFGTSIEVRKTDPTVIDQIRDGGVAYVTQDKLSELKRLKALLETLKKEIGNNPSMFPYKDQLIIEESPNGLMIQIVDKEDRPMFAPGSANLKHYTEELLYELAKSIDKVSNKISITGHTDASPLRRNNGRYTNWELSSDRANSARRALIDGGLPIEKIGKVTGLAATVLLDKDNPLNPINRRISIIVMKKEVSDLAKQDEEISAIPSELIQGTKGLDEVKDNLSLPLSAETLDEQGNPRSSGIDGRSDPLATEVLDIDSSPRISNGNGSRDTNLSVDMEIQGLNDGKPAEQQPSAEIKSEEDDDSYYDLPESLREFDEPRERVIRKSDENKQFITLPPIIDPELLPKR